MPVSLNQEANIKFVASTQGAKSAARSPGQSLSSDEAIIAEVSTARKSYTISGLIRAGIL